MSIFGYSDGEHAATGDFVLRDSPDLAALTAAEERYGDACGSMDQWAHTSEVIPADVLTKYNAAQLALRAICPHIHLVRRGRASKLTQEYQCQVCHAVTTFP